MRTDVGQNEREEKIIQLPHALHSISGHEVTRDAAGLEQEVEMKWARLASSQELSTSHGAVPGSSQESCRPEESLRPRTCTIVGCSTVELDMDMVISENCPADVSSTLQLCHTGLFHPAGWPDLSSMYALGQGSTFEPEQKDCITATVSTCRVCSVVSGTLS